MSEDAGNKCVISTGKDAEAEAVRLLMEAGYSVTRAGFTSDEAASGTAERRKREEELRRLSRTLTAHSNSSRAMIRAQDEIEYLNEVCRIVVEDCGHAMVWVGYAEDDEYKSVRPVAYHGFEEGYLETLKITWADTERGRGPTGAAIRTGKPSMCRNMLTDPKFEPWRGEALSRGYASSLVLPLAFESETFGALTIYFRDPDPFSGDEVALLSSLADDLAYGIQSLRLRAEHAKAEEALREREEHLRLFVEHAPVALALFDADMRYLAASRRWMADFDLGEGDIVGRSHYDIFPDIPEWRKEIHRRCLAGGIERADEDRFERDDGSAQWLRWEVRPWKQADESIGGIVIFSEDITERKLVENAQLFLLQCGWPGSGEKFFPSLASYLAETLDMDFVCIDRLSGDLLSAETVAVYFDGKFEDNISYALKDTPCGDVVGKAICCFPRDVRALFPKDEVLQEMMADGYIGTTLWSSKGEPIGLIALISRKPLANPELAESILRLVAIRAAGELEREQAEHELGQARSEAERRAAELESFIASMSDGVLLLDSEEKVILSNEVAVDILGANPGASLPERVRDSGARNMDGSPVRLDQSPSHMAMQGETARDRRFLIPSPDQGDRVISFSSSPVRGPDGRVLGAATVVRDITDQAEFERQKDELYEREHHIAEVLQQALIPPCVPTEFGCLAVGVRYQSALNEAEVGGDFYDIFDLGGGKVGVLIGDVAGKGLGAAIRVAAARYSVRSYALVDPRPSHVMTLANEALCRDSKDEVNMLTAFFAVIDTGTGKMVYATAGHEPAVLCSASGEIRELECGEIPLGILEATAYTENTLDLHPGDSVIVVTDGITEARAPGTVLFKKKGMIEYLSNNMTSSPDETAGGLLATATVHAGGQLQDDAAVVVLRLASEQPDGSVHGR